MGDTTKIQWTDATWNPVRGCSVVSAGCANCYAAGVAARFNGPDQPYEGLAVRSIKRGLPQWTGKVRVVPEHLGDPLRWTRPRRVFVNSMSDLFHEGLTSPEIAAIFGVMAAATRHTFQVLTKRPERALNFFRWLHGVDGDGPARARWYARKALGAAYDADGHDAVLKTPSWPFQNVWLGVSVENQDTADLRVNLLLECPAAVRFVSYEPALGPVDWHPSWFGYDPGPTSGFAPTGPGIDWIIVGGESGPRARGCDVAWVRATIDACSRYGAACFVKQLGADPYDVDGPADTHLRPGQVTHRKGGDPAEWPTALRVREWPR